MVTASAVFNALELFYLFETSNSSPHFGMMTSKCLVNLDDEIPSSLESMPKHYGKHVGNAVSILFSVLDVEVETAVKSLSSALKHERMGVRLTAVIALGSCGLHSPGAVSMLASMVAQTELRVGVRVTAAETLGSLGPHAASAAPALASELNDGNAQVRDAAAEALVALQENAVSAIPIIQRLLQKGDWWVQVAACNTIAGLGQIAGSMIPDLQNILTTAERHSVKVAALKALSSVGQNDTSILPDILEAVFDTSEKIRNIARRTLKDLSKDANVDHTFLLNMLKNGKEWQQVLAAETLEILGSDEFPVIRELQTALESNTQRVKTAACKALYSLGQRPSSDPETAMLTESHETKDMLSGTEYTQNSGKVQEDGSNTACLYNQKTYFHEQQTWPGVKKLTSQGNLPKKEAHAGQTWADVKKLDSEGTVREEEAREHAVHDVDDPCMSSHGEANPAETHKTRNQRGHGYFIRCISTWNDPVPDDKGSRNEALCDHQEISFLVARIFKASGNSSSTAAPSEEEYVLLPRTSEPRDPGSS